jgi:mannose-6-phosphate isomerase-like protein (cupin superfamily)
MLSFMTERRKNQGKTMPEADLPKLTSLVKKMLKNRDALNIIDVLKTRLLESNEPFVWATLPRQLIGEEFPKGIRSAWIFVLRPRYHTSPHYHPNSIQHTAVIEGGGWAKIGDQEVELQVFNSQSIQPIWYVIGKGVSHEFVTRDSPVVVVSFHTCLADELVEVEMESGSKRLYERKGT